ncbi:Ribosomal protein/NADH dehydrogenase domain protein [Ophiocordyceps camponoti-floridani]|uniref:Ribosomal protein/NADH dehydrogenase domain protein n=1 Tax=Ophiocordyceps camponoti-floridani TaxID=2030778 RepID=A0A8H4Q1X7_9HYPO|nr:Ribosomal protein/NADH dehydrogenase domain protein [Ophiocordyceps camponoti-floridani]
MRSLGSRLTRLRQRLIKLRCGPGAAILPKEVTTIHLDFATSMFKGHMGARKFWRQYLPLLKYHNPGVAMIVNRHTNNESSPTLTIYFRTGPAQLKNGTQSSVELASSCKGLSPPRPPQENERVEKIDMRDLHSSAILESFFSMTGATRLAPSESDLEEMRVLETLKKNAAMARERTSAENAKKKAEKEMEKKLADKIAGN